MGLKVIRRLLDEVLLLALAFHGTKGLERLPVQTMLAEQMDSKQKMGFEVMPNQLTSTNKKQKMTLQQNLKISHAINLKLLLRLGIKT